MSEFSGLADALIGLAQGRDSEAWSYIVEHHSGILFQTAYGVLGDAQLTEDAVQNTLLSIRDHASQFSVRSNAANKQAFAWMKRIALTQALQLYRSRTAAIKRENTLAVEATVMTQEDSDAHEELLKLVRDELAELPEKQQVPILLKFYGGLGYEEIAEELQCSLAYSRTCVHRSIKALQKRLRKAGATCSLVALTAAIQAHELQVSSLAVPPQIVSQGHELLHSPLTGDPCLVPTLAVGKGVLIAGTAATLLVGVLSVSQFSVQSAVVHQGEHEEVVIQEDFIEEKAEHAVAQTDKKRARVTKKLDDIDQKRDAIIKDQRNKYRRRVQLDRNRYGNTVFEDVERKYQAASREKDEPAQVQAYLELIQMYPDANRAGCAVQYLGQSSEGDAKIAYLEQAIADYSDCWYGSGVQVGTYARFYLAHHYLSQNNTIKAEQLFEETYSLYPDAIRHSGKLMFPNGYEDMTDANN